MKVFSRIRVLAIASGGGHWVQLWRMRPAWKGCNIIYVSTSESRCREIIADAKQHNLAPPPFYCVVDANRWEKLKLVKQLIQITIILLREKPHVIISTGAAPGFFALKIGKWLGARTVWVDSIANAETLSLSGEKAGGCADLWLTQWKHLTDSNDTGKRQPKFKGAVL